MQFFTSEWATGDQDDGDPVAEYTRFLSTLDKDSAVYTFATSVSLNDAIIEHAVFEQASKSFKLVLLTGDLQIGYWRTKIQYTDATLIGREILAEALHEHPSEIWYDEFFSNSDRLSHSLLLVPRSVRLSDGLSQEFSVQFTSFSYTQHAVANREITPPVTGFEIR
ncbi:hypothetical protein GOZ78_17360 [Agrobacterium vitis]|uniref:Uncharacterized protein n=1 Tax=Agrobacterium vitis TaxID=373 RepID=A0ABD6GFI7_AGRVI|nr:hypothetical protein [Agrobacterium vitis]MUO79360.1 hypothetical protein [Agrobacterium vitis]MUO96185.1 hypothetical protein [Agrobacterium vitis]MUP05750.1 hypothetical protein [Agrobacterium vitis]MUZ82834.1 hypothetical protein [Agrobacterium vitis]MVA11790.1 hypothetical protein [Agrobacterium vitis]